MYYLEFILLDGSKEKFEHYPFDDKKDAINFAQILMRHGTITAENEVINVSNIVKICVREVGG